MGQDLILQQVDESVQSCLKNPEAFVKMLVEAGSHRGKMKLLYSNMVMKKHLPPIEGLDQLQKIYYWKEANKENEKYKGTLAVPALADLAKILYFMDVLLKPYVKAD